MAFLSGMKAFFTGTKAVEKGIDLIGKGLDASFFTSEEKSQANQKVLDWKLKWIQATGAQSTARRYIAFLVVGLWVFLVVLTVMLYLTGFKSQSEYVFDLLNEIVNAPFLMIVGFYYLAHVVRTNKQ